jgi:hypothetical protein
MRDFARFASTILALTAFTSCLLTLRGLGPGLDAARRFPGSILVSELQRA